MFLHNGQHNSTKPPLTVKIEG